ncbi:hypothetical protein ACIQPQ_34670 [Streptomyces sp. NPDC091281]|uniref:hypothetical protein n=1 Tax=Streptomyces sp. NPDC091281 TaxID=3365985 RepID=UPI0037F16F1A
MTSTMSPQHIADPETRRALHDALLRITGRVLVEVRITRTRWPEGLRWVAMVQAVDRKAPSRRREIPLAHGGQHKKIALLLRDAFPFAKWDRAQDYDVTSGVLRQHVVQTPSFLRGENL